MTKAGKAEATGGGHSINVTGGNIFSRTKGLTVAGVFTNNHQCKERLLIQAVANARLGARTYFVLEYAVTNISYFYL